MGDAVGRSETVTRNAAAAAFGAVVGVVVSLAVVPITLSALGAVGFGVMQTMLSIGGLVMLGDLGLGLAVRTEVGKLAGSGHHDELRIFLGHATVALSLLALVFVTVGGIAMLSVLDVGTIFHLPDELRSQGRNALIIAGVTFALKMPLSIFASAQAGLQIGDRLILWQTGGNILSSVGAAVAALATQRLDLTVGVQMAINLAAIVGTAIAGSRIAPSSVPRLGVPSLRKGFGVIRNGFAYYVLNLETAIIGGLDNLVIARMVGPEAVAAYSVAHRLMGFAYSLVYPLAGSFWNGVANAIGGRDIAWIEAEAVRLRRVATLLLTILGAGVIAVARPLIHLWTRGRVDVDPWLPVALGGYFLLNGHTMFDGAMLAGSGRVRAMLILVGAEALVNFGASVGLAVPFGYVGVGMGTLIGYAVCDFIPIQIVFGRVLSEHAGPGAQVRPRRWWTRELSAGVAAIVASFGLYQLVAPNIDASPIVLVFILGAGSLALSLLIVRVIGGAEAWDALRALGSRLRARITGRFTSSPSLGK